MFEELSLLAKRLAYQSSLRAPLKTPAWEANQRLQIPFLRVMHKSLLIFELTLPIQNEGEKNGMKHFVKMKLDRGVKLLH